MTVMTGGRTWWSSSSSSIVLAAEELGPQGGLLLLAGVDQADLGADLGGEQTDHVVGERLGGRDHLALEQEEAHDVAGGAVEARAELLRRGAALDDHLVVGNRSAGGQISRDLDRLQLLHVATAAAGPALGRAPASDRTTSRGTGRATGRVAAATRSRGSPHLRRPPPVGRPPSRGGK